MLLTATLLGSDAMSTGGTIAAVVAGGVITFGTATIGQIVAERYRRRADVQQNERALDQARRDRQRVALETLLTAQQALGNALTGRRGLDLERPRTPQARAVVQADNVFREIVPQVRDDRVRLLALRWRDTATRYARLELGIAGGPQVGDVDAARDALADAVGLALRTLDEAEH